MDDDETAIRRVLDGDREAFRVLVDRHRGPVVAFIRNLLPDRNDREDIAQEAFVAAYSALDRFDPDRGTFGAWLFRIARNRAVNARKKKRPFPMAEVPDAGTHDRATDDGLCARLDRALAALPFAQRAAFVMAEVHDLSYEEIARVEGVRLGTVKSRIGRARKKLRRRLEEAGDDD